MKQKLKPIWTYKLYPYWKMLIKSGQYSIDNAWLDFYTFNADVGLRPQGHGLKQVDPTKPLGPGNFVWATSFYRKRIKKAKDHIRSTFYSMWNRCNNPSNHEFRYYGGRGIKVCDAWKSFDQFKADMGVRPHGYSLERKDVNGHYSPENCVWADSIVQGRNKRNTVYVWHCGMKLDLMTACQLTGRNHNSIRVVKHNSKGRLTWQRCFEATGKERADIKVRRLLRNESRNTANSV